MNLKSNIDGLLKFLNNIFSYFSESLILLIFLFVLLFLFSFFIFFWFFGSDNEEVSSNINFTYSNNHNTEIKSSKLNKEVIISERNTNHIKKKSHIDQEFKKNQVQETKEESIQKDLNEYSDFEEKAIDKDVETLKNIKNNTGKIKTVEIKNEKKIVKSKSNSGIKDNTPIGSQKFEKDLSDGSMRLDEKYGFLYTSEPDQVDDLTSIKGVAKILSAKLNEFGVYRFKQIASWNDDVINEFSKVLYFKKRIYTDNWIAQSKTFHEIKYNEVL